VLVWGAKGRQPQTKGVLGTGTKKKIKLEAGARAKKNPLHGGGMKGGKHKEMSIWGGRGILKRFTVLGI